MDKATRRVAPQPAQTSSPRIALRPFPRLTLTATRWNHSI